jgi:hypothetical protein
MPSFQKMTIMATDKGYKKKADGKRIGKKNMKKRAG